MKKIVSVIGTRPEVIKIAALSPILKKHFKHITIHTGQHYDYKMSGTFFDELSIDKPDYNLNVGSGTHSQQTAKILQKMEKILIKENPALVIVYGDTNSTLGGALAASKLNIPVAHFESGMRNFDNQMPEEINRKIVDHISSIYFCCSKKAVANLKKEGIVKNVYFSGDIHYDIFLQRKPNISILNKLNIHPKKFYFATIHRQENTNVLEKLRKILKTLEKVDNLVVLALHPRTKKAVLKLKENFPNIKIIDPVNFEETIGLQISAKAIITDSGGIQKESYWLKVPCFTLRNSTEWIETVETRWNFLVGDNLSSLPLILKHINTPQNHPNFYGDGNSATKITKILVEYLR